jgi:hypothetical protein
MKIANTSCEFTNIDPRMLKVLLKMKFMLFKALKGGMSMYYKSLFFFKEEQPVRHLWLLYGS